MKINISSLLKGLDVAGDLGGLEKLREVIFPGKKSDSPKEEAAVKPRGPGQEQLIEAVIFDIAAEYLLGDDAEQKALLKGPAALAAYNRVCDDFYQRNPQHRDRYNIQLGQNPQWAIGDEGLGTRRKEAAKAAAAPQPQQGQQGQGRKQQGGGNPNTSSSPTGVTNLDPIKLMLAIKVCLGKKAQAADSDPKNPYKKNKMLAGDKVILQAIERFEQVSLLEKGKQALEKGGKATSDFIDGFLNEI